MVVNNNFIFDQINLYYIFGLVFTSLLFFMTNLILFNKDSSNHDKNIKTVESENTKENKTSNNEQNKESQESQKSKEKKDTKFKNINQKEAYLQYLKDYLNKNKNLYNVKFNLDYGILKNKYYNSTYLTKILKYLVDSTTRRHYAVKVKLKSLKNPFIVSEIKKTLEDYKGTKNYILFLKLLNQQNSLLYYQNFKNNNYVNNVFFYNLTKKLNFTSTYKFLNKFLYTNLLEDQMNLFNSSHSLSRFKIEFKFLKSLMNRVYKGSDPLHGLLYKFFNYRYYENHLLFTMKRIYNRFPSTKYFVRYYLDFFSEVKYEIQSLYKLVHTANFVQLLRTEQLQFTFLPIEGTKLFTSELKKYLGSGELQRVFFDFLSASNFLPFSDRNDYDYPYYTPFYSYYNRLAKYFTNKRTILEGSFLIETQIYLFLSRYFPTMENIFLLKKSIPFISYKDYLFGITRYTFPNFYDFKFYLPFPIEELEDMFGINEHHIITPSFYSIYYKRTINLFDFIRPDSFKAKEFLLSNEQLISFRLHRNYFFRQLLGSFNTALQKLEYTQQNNNQYSLLMNNIFQFLYGKNSEDIFNVNIAQNEKKPAYEGSIAFASLKNISMSMSYKKAGFLNKLTRLSKRYEDYLGRVVGNKYLKFLYKLKRSYKRIYFKLNSQRMKFKINLYEILKEIVYRRYEAVNVLFSFQQGVMIHTIINNYFHSYFKNSSMFKFKFNYYYTQLADPFDYVLIKGIQFYLNIGINYLNALIIHKIANTIDLKINLSNQITFLNKILFNKFYKLYNILIQFIINNIVTFKMPLFVGFHMGLYLSHLIIKWIFESLDYLINLFYFLSIWKIDYWIQYILLKVTSFFNNIIITFQIVLFILKFQIHRFDFIFLYFYLFFIKSNIIIQLIVKFFQLDSLVIFKTSIDYLFWYWPMYIDGILDIIADRIVYLWSYQHFYLYMPSFIFWNYFIFFNPDWYDLTMYPLNPILLWIISQFWIIFTYTKFYQFFSSSIFIQLFQFFQNIFTNPNFVLKFLLGYIIILIHYFYHSYYILSPFFPIIYLICIILFCLIYLVIHIKISAYKMRLSRHFIVPKFYFGVFSFHYLKVFYYFLDNFLGGFLTYARLALIFLLAVENAKEENWYRAQKFKELKEKNISYKLNLEKIKKHL